MGPHFQLTFKHMFWLLGYTYVYRLYEATGVLLDKLHLIRSSVAVHAFLQLWTHEHDS
jgi:hypothetical protein